MGDKVAQVPLVPGIVSQDMVLLPVSGNPDRAPGFERGGGEYLHSLSRYLFRPPQDVLGLRSEDPEGGFPTSGGRR